MCAGRSNSWEGGAPTHDVGCHGVLAYGSCFEGENKKREKSGVGRKMGGGGSGRPGVSALQNGPKSPAHSTLSTVGLAWSCVGVPTLGEVDNTRVKHTKARHKMMGSFAGGHGRYNNGHTEK